MPKKFKAVQGTDGYVYPVTSTDLVVDSDNNPITESLNSTKTKLAEHEANIENNANRINNTEERITATEVKNEQQDERLKNIEVKNKVQDIDLKCLFADSKDGTVNISEEGNSVKLQNSRDGYVVVNEIEGNTLVNCNKEPNKELILNGNIDTNGDNSITLTEGVDGGKVDVALEGNTLVNVSKTKDVTPITHESEDITGNHIALANEGSIRPVVTGNTMVNVCDQKDPVAITKSYTVETGNHVALQGEYDGKCRPVVTGNTLVNLIDKFSEAISPQGPYTVTNKGFALTKEHDGGISYFRYKLKYPLDKSKKYTIIYDIIENTLTNTEPNFGIYTDGVYGALGSTTTTGGSADGKLGRMVNAYPVKTNNECLDYLSIGVHQGDAGGKVVIDNLMLLEGDYTDKPIPDYFEGLQSTFEDNLVTQEMVDNGEEEAENLGKYKVDYVVTGKNKFDKSKTLDGYEIAGTGTRIKANWFVTDFIPVIPNTSYKISAKPAGDSVIYYDNNKQVLEEGKGGTSLITIPNNARYVKLNGLLTQKDTFQLEEGTVATTYEPYKEYKKTFYLNSPLLEGDTIEQQGNNVVHIHRYGKVEDIAGVIETVTENNNNFDYLANINCVLYKISGNYYNKYVYSDKLLSLNDVDKPYTKITGANQIYINQTSMWVSCDKSKTTDEFISFINSCNIIAKLQTPQYEVISQNDTILCDSYVNGHLDVDSIVPIKRVNFMPTQLSPLKYVYKNTKYTLQFESDNVGKIDYLMIGQQTATNIDVIKGLNKINITTTASTSLYLDFRGIGFNASNIVVTPAIDQEFDYFSGMQSSFEDSLVTEGEHAGKYKVDYVVTGKNKFDGKWQKSEGVYGVYYYGKGTYTISIQEKDLSLLNSSCALGYSTFDGRNTTWLFSYNQINKTNVTVTDCRLVFRIPTEEGLNLLTSALNVQIEEGTEATPYEPYKEHTKTLYLNSPLLEGDTIEEKDGNVYHVHRYMGKVITGDDVAYSSNNYKSDTYNAILTRNMGNQISDVTDNRLYSSLLLTKAFDNGLWERSNNVEAISYVSSAWGICIKLSNSKTGCTSADSTEDVKRKFATYLNNNHLPIVYKLQTPQYELIQQSDTIAMPTYSAGHLDVTSAVPLDKVNFLPFEEEMTYLYPSTKYAIQFTSNNVSVADITLGGAKISAQNIAKGLNKVFITTGETLTDNKLVIDGYGANISEVVVTNTDRDFGYFEGMKSVGECEDLEVVSCNKNLFDTQSVVNKYSNKVTIIDNGIQVDNGVYILKDVININPNKQYTLSWNCEKVSGEGTSGLEIVYTDGGFNYRIGEGSQILTSDKGRTIDFIRITYSTSGVTNLTNIQLEEGSTATDYIPHASNTQTLQHEPLRGVGDIKDRYVLIDGKWYIERNCGEVVLDGSDDEKWLLTPSLDDTRPDYFIMLSNDFNFGLSYKQICNSMVIDNPYENYNQNIICAVNDSIRIRKDELGTVNNLKIFLQSNPITIVYALVQPQYEPIDYNPFEVYSDITHISNNSTIPCNMTIKNTGYNCLLKPSTTYTVSSNLGLNTVTTPSTLTEDCLRFYDTDTSTVTTMKDVTILEGDYTTGKPIPSYFSGIESAFEQEYDEEVGKYKVKAKVVGKNLFDGSFSTGYIENDGTISNAWKDLVTKDYISVIPGKSLYIFTTYTNFPSIRIYEYDANKQFIKKNGKESLSYNTHFVRIDIGGNFNVNGTTQLVVSHEQVTLYEPYKENYIEFYINEPLRGIGDVKDKVYVKDDKIVVERNCGSVVLDGSEDEGWGKVSYAKWNTVSGFKLTCMPKNWYIRHVVSNLFRRGTNSYPTDEEAFTNGDDSGDFYIKINNAKLQTQDVAGFKQWLQQNPTTVVYQLAEPTYEEVNYDNNELIAESFKDATLFYENNVPVTSRVNYTFSIPVVDEVAAVSTTTDAQDVAIASLSYEQAMQTINSK